MFRIAWIPRCFVWTVTIATLGQGLPGAFPAMALGDEAAHPAPEQVEFFEKRIRPLLVDKCWSCHAGDKVKGGLSLESGTLLRNGGDSGAVVTPGDPDDSLLLDAVKHLDGLKMPPDGKLAESEIADLETWVRNGAVWPIRKLQVPLGNVFDDAAETSLADALASDEFKATAGADDLGVDRVLFGWGEVAEVAPGVRINLGPLGASSLRYGEICNDAWNTIGGLRTLGEPLPADAPRHEAGIGLHANALITFDLTELRSAGQMPADTPFVFRAERAGLNDDVLRSGAAVHMGVAVVRSVEGGGSAVEVWVNGKPVACEATDGVWQLRGELPGVLRPDGVFAQFDVPVPAAARYLVLFSTAGEGPADNRISSDHAVFSGARLEFSTDSASVLQLVVSRELKITAEQRAFWSFQPIGRPEPPAVQQEKWVRQGVDRFILAELEKRGLSPSPEADRRTLIRRVTFDLIGLPPTPEEIAEFVNDSHADAYERLVERLLASPHFGERWGRHWLDVARYAEDQAHTFQARMYPNGFEYRDWVVRALNADLPYDEFVVHQIAGDLMPGEPTNDRLAPLGYFALGPVYYSDAGCAAKAALDELDDRIDTLAAGFLGLTVACARCHDHKFDPITQRDYYALAGVFSSTGYREAPLVPKDVVEVYTAGQQRIQQAEQAWNGHLDAESRRLAEVHAGKTAGYLEASWLWAHWPTETAKPSLAEFSKGRGLEPFLLERWEQFVQPGNRGKLPALNDWFAVLERADLTVTDGGVPEAVRQAAEGVQLSLDDVLGKPAEDASRQELIKLLRENNGPLQIPRDRVEALLEEAAKPRAAELKTALETARKDAPPKYPFAHSLTEGTIGPIKLRIRGNPAKTGPEVPRRFLEVLAPEPAPLFQQGSGRLELARAIASAENPLTARVMVNRLWQQHFGRGLVATPSNFGQLGERPSHPQLLDYLAGRLIDQGWSLKAVHREMVLSATYRQSSAANAGAMEQDGDNVWLWRMPRRRLDVESWRDGLLAVTGVLERKVGGAPGDLADAGFVRRTLYGKISRHNLNSLLRLFDFPDPNISSAKRTQTTVPLQQLFVLNSEFMIRRAQELARRLAGEGADDRERILRAYALLYGREASEDELAAGLEFLRSPVETGSRLNAWEQYAQVLLAGNEFTFID